ncbi:MAG: APC family permease [Nitrospiraceae bacterium]|nr:MAG: APC family permease [Nitrospiraceae bacterium]
MWFKRWLLGRPLRAARLAHERLTKTVALAVFSSDALSSVAYATEEILLVLVLAGAAAFHYSISISIAIVGLLAILTVSYRRIIFVYPSGGGAYVVSKANLGELPGLVAGASLMIDYVLTVSVSVAAGIAAITSAVPELHDHRVGLGLLAIAILTWANLRGVRESGRLFAVPTYLFVGGLGLVLVMGLGRSMLGVQVELPETPAVPVVEGLTLFLLLRAFSSGCTALTGVEAISNGIPTFKEPASENAATTMTWMAAILGTLFLGLTALAHIYGMVPREDETLISQIARAAFGGGPLYYLVQIATMMILILAANTSFNGFPRLASLLAQDGFLPRQMRHMGDRLVFSNGIFLLGAFAGLLLIVFRGDTHALIPLYAVGVFLSFTLAQAGMVHHWMDRKGRGWRKGLAINLTGAVATGIATLVLAVTKFTHGAWVVIVLVPVLILMFRKIRWHYKMVDWQLALDMYERPAHPPQSTVVMPISGVNRSVVLALDYVRQRGQDVRAVHVDVDPVETDKVKAEWAKWGAGLPLVILPSPYRSFLEPLLDYIEKVRQENPGGWVTVALAEVLPARWWENLLHNQRALLIKAAVLFKFRVIVTDVPYHLGPY